MELIIHILAAVGIMTLGLAHGAIDNILFGVQPGRSNWNFITGYIFIIFLFAMLWVFFPNVALLLFLLTSSYHFGQSQFVEYNFQPRLLSKGLFFTWGGIVLLCMFHFKGQEVLSLQEVHFQQLPVLDHLIEYALYYLIGLAGTYSLIILTVTYLNKFPISLLLKETYILGLLACSMYVFSAFLAFSLFFVLLHSLKVIAQEFEHSKKKLRITSVQQFIRLFLPLTLGSFLGIAVILLFVYQLDIHYLLPYILLILLSSITIPHSFVMEKFYGTISSNN